jgi:hypothetical protein
MFGRSIFVFWPLNTEGPFMKARELLFRATIVVSLVAGVALMLYDAGERYNLFRDTLARELVIGKTNQEFVENTGYLYNAASGKNSATDISQELLNKERDSIGVMDVVTRTRFPFFMGTFFLLGFAQVWMLYFLIMIGLTSKKRRS